uniref:Endonuclease/exonuclease/phosphatase domain-containing protein n=1 Tax=Latimeria chalumnae TaxID=7897 RepID=H3B055_LATCH
LYNTKIALINVYAPNSSDATFFAQLQALLLEIPDLPIIMGGDFNQVLDPVLDGSRPEKPQKSPPDRSALRDLASNYGLVDIWRLIHPQSLEFTFRSSSHGTRSRIDMFLISKGMVNSVQSCSIGVRALSDHSPVDLESGVSRKGRWRFNSSLLNSETIRAEIKAIIQEYFAQNAGLVPTDTSLWEAGKAYIRGRIIALSSRVKRENNKRVIDIGELEAQSSPLLGDEDFRELREAKFELNTIYHNKAEYALFRLKQKQCESGERAGKLLASLVHQQEARRWISAVELSGGTLLTDPQDI